MRYQFRDIHYLNTCFFLLILDPVRHHGIAKRTSRGNQDPVAVSSASSVLSTKISFSPFSASLNICAPPAPQHKPLDLHLLISTKLHLPVFLINAPRSLVNTVGPTQVTRVVKSNPFTGILPAFNALILPSSSSAFQKLLYGASPHTSPLAQGIHSSTY